MLWCIQYGARRRVTLVERAGNAIIHYRWRTSSTPSHTVAGLHAVAGVAVRALFRRARTGTSSVAGIIVSAEIAITARRLTRQILQLADTISRIALVLCAFGVIRRITRDDSGRIDLTNA